MILPRHHEQFLLSGKPFQLTKLPKSKRLYGQSNIKQKSKKTFRPPRIHFDEISWSYRKSQLRFEIDSLRFPLAIRREILEKGHLDS